MFLPKLEWRWWRSGGWGCWKISCESVVGWVVAWWWWWWWWLVGGGIVVVGIVNAIGGGVVVGYCNPHRREKAMGGEKEKDSRMRLYECGEA